MEISLFPSQFIIIKIELNPFLYIIKFLKSINIFCQGLEDINRGYNKPGALSRRI